MKYQKMMYHPNTGTATKTLPDGIGNGCLFCRGYCFDFCLSRPAFANAGSFSARASLIRVPALPDARCTSFSFLVFSRVGHVGYSPLFALLWAYEKQFGSGPAER